MNRNRRLILPAPNGKVFIEEGVIPKPPPRGAVVKISYAGVCHTDETIWEKNTIPTGGFPRVLGHEISGTIHTIGDANVKDAPVLRQGDPVIVYAIIGCERCVQCKAGLPVACPERINKSEKVKIIGMNLDGGFQEYVAVPDRRYLVPVPSSVPLDIACLLPCSGVTAYNAVCSAKEAIEYAKCAGASVQVAIVGFGGLGHWAFNLLRTFYSTDIRIIVVDILTEKLEVAKRAGADELVHWLPADSGTEMTQKLKAVASGPITTVLDFVTTTETVGACFPAMAQSGVMVLVGSYMGINLHMPSVPLQDVIFKPVHIKGIFVGTLSQMKDLLEILTQKRVRLPEVCHIELQHVEDCFKNMKAGRSEKKCVVDFTKNV